jgi:rhodanese-related sulfurtransferase/biotin operon repressor
MSSENPRRTVFSHFALIGRAISNGHRLEMIDLMAQGERSVDDMARQLGLSVANTSQHLQQLRRVGLVATRKQGQHVFYRLSDGSVIELLASLRHIAESNLSEVQQVAAEHFRSKDKLDALSREELLDRLRGGQATVVDVRPPEEFAAGHVAGAISLPLKDLERELGRLPAGHDVVAYCRGPYCTLAYDAVALLRAKGYTAFRLEEGFPQWKQSGFPTEIAG